MESSSVAGAVEAAAQGSADAFEDLYGEYAGPLQGYVRKTVGDPDHAEDLCQEISRQTGASTPAVESLLVRARKGFLDAYRALEGDPDAACAQARAAAVAIDSGTATVVQRKALELHQERCLICRPAPVGLRKV